VSVERGFRRIVALLSLAAFASGLLFTAALGVGFVRFEAAQYAIERTYTGAGCVSRDRSRNLKPDPRLVITSLEPSALGPYRWRVNIPSPLLKSLWSEARPFPPGVIPEDPGPAKVHADQVQSMVYGTWVVSAPRELSREELLRAIAIHQRGWIERWFVGRPPAHWLGVSLRNLPALSDLVAARMYVLECKEELRWATADDYLTLLKIAGQPSTPLPSGGFPETLYTWWFGHVISLTGWFFPASWVNDEQKVTLVLGWRWLWLPPVLALTAFAAVLPWAAFHGIRGIVAFLRWIRRGFTEA